MNHKTEITLGAVPFFVEVSGYTVTFTESRPVSMGQHGVTRIMLSRTPGLNSTPGIWTITHVELGTPASQVSEAHLYCINRFGASFAPYIEEWIPGKMRDGVWTPVQQTTCSDETTPAPPPDSPILRSPETDPGASGS